MEKSQKVIPSNATLHVVVSLPNALEATLADLHSDRLFVAAAIVFLVLIRAYEVFVRWKERGA